MIGYYAHHQGLGHLTRLQSIAAHLTTPVTGLSSLPAPRGWHSDWVQLDRDDAMPPEDVAGADPTARGTLHWVPRHDAGLAGRAAAVAAWAAQARPSLLVVDVSVEISLLGRLCGVPVVVVAMPGPRSDRPHALAYDLADALLAPWPEGAHARDWPPAWRSKLWAVGGISRFDHRLPAGSQLPRAGEPAGSAEASAAVAPGASASGSASGGRRRVLVLWGGGGRRTSTGQLAAARAATPGWEWVERSPRTPSPDLWADLATADVVVTHGGQNAVAEVAAARRPAVVVAQPRPFDEQEATAAAVDRLGCAVGLSGWPEASRWPALLDRAVERGGQGWSHWSTGHGARSAAVRLDALARRAGCGDSLDRAELEQTTS